MNTPTAKISSPNNHGPYSAWMLGTVSAMIAATFVIISVTITASKIWLARSSPWPISIISYARRRRAAPRERGLASCGL
ncbi:MAG: hypothetical protein HOP09_09230 [Hyphomicrobium sp.]|nr:hypothetical protein [Hyphomicrobium sp.]